MKGILLRALWAMAIANSAHGAASPFEDDFRQFDGESWPPGNDYRNAAGAPGHRYWQQQADYDIAARLDEGARTVTGRARVRYLNRSPDALPYLWLLLDQNRFKRDSAFELTRRVEGEQASLHDVRRALRHRQWEGGFTIRRVSDVSGAPLRFDVIDGLMRVDLPRPVAANGGEVRFDIEWSFPFNETAVTGGRGGYECFRAEEGGSCIFQAGQWFPRLAAYTDYEGWHDKTFLGTGEFTLEFGDYRVSITVPADHVVSATGELRNVSQVLTPLQRKRLRQARGSPDPIYIVTPAEAEAAERTPSEAEKTWIFQARRVRDFAWASSRKFAWDAMGVPQEAATQPVVMAMSFFPRQASPLWDELSTRVIAHTLRVFSQFTFPYPYPVAQSVNGPVGASHGGGIEYPMIAFNGSRPRLDPKTGKPADAREVRDGLIGTVIHETGHNYFPMIVNSDERRWAWMDEGLVTFLEFHAAQRWDAHYSRELLQGEPADAVEYMLSPAQAPPMTQADSLRRLGGDAYAKPSTALVVLRETILGRERFDRAFREYARRWQFKRPTPFDFFRTLEESSGIDLDWFWRGWFYSTGHVDIALDSVVRWRPDDAAGRDASFYRFTFRNAGGLVMPVILRMDFADGGSETVRIPAEIWRPAESRVTWQYVTDRTLVRAEIDPLQETADTDRGNNVHAGPIEARTLRISGT